MGECSLVRLLYRTAGPLAWIVLAPLAAHAVDFARDVQPVFAARCGGCHGPATQSSGLRLDRKAEALAGGYSGRVIIPGQPEKSRLYRLIAGLEAKAVMPPAGPRLASAEVAAIRAWILEGAPWPEAERTASGGVRATAQHWAFAPPVRSTPPKVRQTAWTRNPIDSFVLARLGAAKLTPSPEADAVTLVRRLHFDLVGLPPSPETVSRYLADSRPDRYERLIDELLQSPHFGEKWARHWLDLSRYSDTEGNESDFERPFAWRYRHWLIDALNRDLPFDQFTIEQIAGDLVPSGRPESRLGLGFHRNTTSNREGGADVEGERVEQVVDRVNAVGLTWMGLTVGCARCHDHKYDPISQKEYYQLFAFFNNADEVNIDAPLPGEIGEYLRQRSQFDRKRKDLLCYVEKEVAALQSEWESRVRDAEKSPGKEYVWDRQWELLALLWEVDTGGGQLEGVTVLHMDPARRTQRQRERLQEHFLKYGERSNPEAFKKLGLTEVSKKLDALKKEYPPLTQAPVLTERAILRRPDVIHLRGDYRNKGIAVSAAVPAVLPPLPSGEPATRLALAQWLLSADHPLTTRVAVNRVWQELFGRGIVATSDDFGTRGAKPSHPQLLDWLAVDFRERGWSLKQLIRTIVSSAAYRQSSHRRPELDKIDPENTLLARQSRLRLPAELVRDEALTVSGLLNPSVGGPSVRPPQPRSVSKEGFITAWVDSTGPDRYRRGLYTHMQRTAPFAQMITFDAPDPNLMCSRRERSNTPLQALTLLNDPVFFEAAQALARKVLVEVPEAASDRLSYTFRLCFGREPSAAERDRGLSYLEREIQRLRDAGSSAAAIAPAALETVDAHTAAAWVLLASSFMNTDEFYTRE